MCLSSVELNLTWNQEENDFVGIGYKAINIADKNGRINYSKVLYQYKTGWNKATGHFSNKHKKDNLATSCTNDMSSYWPGFHIFLKPESAADYISNYALVKVMFKGVTSFGKNLTHNSGRASCVVAKEMKILRIVSVTGREYLERNTPKPKCKLVVGK